MITLRSDRLRVEIAEPGECPNDGFRFDRAGFISNVILDGFMHFCASEPQNLPHPSSGGRGLCNEYRGDVSAQVQVGEYFPKFGVGLIRKEADEPYVIFKRYRDVKPFPVSVAHGDASASFVTRPLVCVGYAVQSEKKITVEGNHLVMEIEMKNTGEKTVDLLEYCHNFISIDGMAVGDAYAIEIPRLKPQGDALVPDRNLQTGNIRGNGKGFAFVAYRKEPFSISVGLDGAEETLPFAWTLRSGGAKASVTETDDFHPDQMSIWSADHIISPEVFCHTVLKSGESRTWMRRWTFKREI